MIRLARSLLVATIAIGMFPALTAADAPGNLATWACSNGETYLIDIGDVGPKSGPMVGIKGANGSEGFDVNSNSVLVFKSYHLTGPGFVYDAVRGIKGAHDLMTCHITDQAWADAGWTATIVGFLTPRG